MIVILSLIHAVGDLENTLASKELDLDQQRSLVEQLDVSILKTQVSLFFGITVLCV